MKQIRLLLILVFFVSALERGSAQPTPAVVTGTIVDASGTGVPGARLVLIGQTTGSRSETQSDAQGNFRLTSVAPDTYRIEAEKTGFEKLLHQIAVASGQTVTVNLTLQPVSGTSQAPGRNESEVSQAAPEEAQVPEPVYEQVTVTARRVEEEVQSVPIPVSVVSGEMIDDTAAFNVNRLKELIPTVQFYSSNPRNSSINIRGLGSPFGLTNDGMEPGVGFYVDGVYYARTAAATLDFLDLERIEVLRGPQGTLFGKNTTAGAIHITTRRPSLTPETNFELSFGNLGFIQAKGSISGPLGKKLAGRLSFSGTQRDGVLHNVRTQDDVNDLNNQGVRAQLMFIPNSKVVALFAADYTRQRPEGYAQVIAGVTPTLRSPSRQYPQIAADLGYQPPSFNAFDRLIDTDTPWRSNQDLGGASFTVDWSVGRGQLTSITAWRFWNWNPSNDRDFIALPVTTVSAAPSRQNQWTQEVRYAARVSDRVNYVAGVFVFGQTLRTAPFHKQEQGWAAARFLLSPTPQALTPGLLDGYGQNIKFDFNNVSAAAFGQLEWRATNRWRIIPGLRFNYDWKDVDYNQDVYGGLQTDDPALIALQRSILSPQAYKASVGDSNVSGQLTVAYDVAESANAYATYSTGFKPIGLNLGGLPADAAGNPIVSAATIRPESVRHIEIGLKSRPLPRVTANLAVFNTEIKDFQTQVVNAQVGVLRGYLANAEKARVRGVEFDSTAKWGDDFTFYASVAFTDGRYITFRDAPPPLEETGGPQAKDISGSLLPGISKWAASYGGEYSRPVSIFGRWGEFFARIDASSRSTFSSSPSASRYLIVDGYSLVNPRIGIRSRDGWTISVWARNVMNTNYFEFLSAAPGNSGLYVGLPGDQRTYGITLSRTFSERGSRIRRRASSKPQVAVSPESPHE
ncbi:MAG: TonB-dependent receptor [Bryobacteraceae bacterium]|nr:TonB-dependent receptor [Bryobacteraceae bacterium]